VDLSRRFYSYYSLPELKRVDNYISRALILHTYSAFSLTILEYIDISNLSKEDARKVILEKEQHYLDTLMPNYNILSTAGSLLGFNHSEETKQKMREAKSGENYYNFGKNLSEHTRAKLRIVNLGKSLSDETKTKLSEALSGENHYNYGKSISAKTRVLISETMKGIAKTEDTKVKLSIAKGGGSIFVYSKDGLLVNTFSSARKAGKYFDCSHPTISNYVKNGKLFKGQWKLSILEITSDIPSKGTSDNN